MHDVAFGTELNEPVGQLRQVEAEAPENVPVTQDMHSDEPGAGATFPATHDAHDEEPTMALNVPAGHKADVVAPDD